MTHDTNTPQKHMLARVDDLTFADPDLVQRLQICFALRRRQHDNTARSVSTNRKPRWAEDLPALAAAGRDMQVHW